MAEKVRAVAATPFGDSKVVFETVIEMLVM